MDGPKTKNGAGTNSGESGVRNLESESIRSGAESTGAVSYTHLTLPTTERV